MNVDQKTNYVIKTTTDSIKTLATAGATHLANVYLTATTVGELLGRAIIQMPLQTAYLPAASAIAITFISAIIENHIVNHYFDTPLENSNDNIKSVDTHKPYTKNLTNFLVRVLVGTALFAAGTAVTGGAILPAIIGGAAMGTLVYVANKVAKVAVDILTYISYLTLDSIYCNDWIKTEIQTHVVIFNDALLNTISPETKTSLRFFIPHIKN